jgi:hypothetical protein
MQKRRERSRRFHFVEHLEATAIIPFSGNANYSLQPLCNDQVNCLEFGQCHVPALLDDILVGAPSPENRRFPVISP